MIISKIFLLPMNKSNRILYSYIIHDLCDVLCDKISSIRDLDIRWNIQIFLWKIIFDIRNSVYFWEIYENFLKLLNFWL